MPDSLQRAMGTPTEVTVDGKVYKLAPWKLKQIADMDAWAKEVPFAELRTKLAHLSDMKLPEATATALVVEADKASKDPLEITRQLRSPAGIHRAVGLSLRVYHPKLTDDEIYHIIDVVGLAVIQKKIEDISFVEGDEKKEGAGR